MSKKVDKYFLAYAAPEMRKNRRREARALLLGEKETRRQKLLSKEKQKEEEAARELRANEAIDSLMQLLVMELLEEA